MPNLSINTNGSALSALFNLNTTTAELEQTQLRINTGLKVNSAKDDAAIYAIAAGQRAELKSYEAVKNSLDRSLSILDVSLSAGQSIQDVLIEMKQKVVAGADAGLDAASRSALAEDFNRLRDQIGIIASNANFNGTNLLNGPTNPPTNPAQLIAIVNSSATSQITVDRQDMQLTPSAGTLAGTEIVLLKTDTTFATPAQAQALIADIDTSIQRVSNSLTIMGASSKSMQTQRTFVDKLSDTIETGIGNLVDANMARESAKLQALQVKQQLGVQALSIANSQPQSILKLFNG